MNAHSTVPESNVKNTGRAGRKGDILGYARVSTADQDVAAQEDRLREAGAIRVFKDVISGKQFERPGLRELIAYSRARDSLCVTRLDRLGRSLKELLETVENLKAIGIHLVSLEKTHRHNLSRRRTGVPCLRGDCPLRAAAHLRKRMGRDCGGQKTRRWPSRPTLDRETVSGAQAPGEAGLTAGQAAKQLGIGRAKAYYRIAKSAR